MNPPLIDISKIKNKKILAFGAHPDDLEFTSAGTIFQLASTKLNNKIHFIVATNGKMGTHDINQNSQELITKRMQEARDSANQLQVDKITFWSYPDLDLQNRKKQLLRKVVKALLHNKPDIVFSFDPWGRYDAYVHSDHRALAWAVTEGIMMSTIPKWLKKKRISNTFLSPKPQLWLYAPTEANVAVDISSVWQERINAVKIFTSQFDNDVKWDKVEKFLTHSYSQFGQSVGVQYAETFRIMGHYEKEYNYD